MKYRLLKEAALQNLIEEDIPYDNGSTNLYLVALEMGNGATDIILADRKPSVEEAQKYYEEVTGFGKRNLPPTENNFGTTVVDTRVISPREAKRIDPEFEDSPFINGKIPPFVGGGAGYGHPRHWERNFGGTGAPFPSKGLGESVFSDDEEDDEDMEDTGPIDSNLDGIISRIRKEHNVGIFKPGYPTAIDEYMILSKDKKQVLELLSEYGLSAKALSGVGYDYNYGGSLWKIKANEDEPKGAVEPKERPCGVFVDGELIRKFSSWEKAETWLDRWEDEFGGEAEIDYL